MDLRREASSLLMLLCLVLGAAHATQPAASWYAQRVLEAFSHNLKHSHKRHKGQQQQQQQPAPAVVLDIEVLQERYLPHGSTSFTFQGREDSLSVQRALVCLRDMCSLAWMFYVRDKVSLGLRQKAHMADVRVGWS